MYVIFMKNDWNPEQKPSLLSKKLSKHCEIRVFLVSNHADNIAKVHLEKKISKLFGYVHVAAHCV